MPGLEPNGLTQFCFEKVILKKLADEKKNHTKLPSMQRERFDCNATEDAVCFDSLRRPSQQFFSHVRKGLPELNQYYAEDKDLVSCSSRCKDS